MSDIESRFEIASREVQELPEKPDNATLLKLYALYKQATKGDATGEKPGFMDFIGQAKHNAWTDLKGTSREEVMQSYIELVEHLKS